MVIPSLHRLLPGETSCLCARHHLNPPTPKKTTWPFVVLLRYAVIPNTLLHSCIPELCYLQIKVRTGTSQCKFRSLDGRWQVKNKVMVQSTAGYLSHKQLKTHLLMINLTIRSIKHSMTLLREQGVGEDKVVLLS